MPQRATTASAKTSDGSEESSFKSYPPSQAISSPDYNIEDASESTIDLSRAKALTRKIDLHIIPAVTILFVLNHLDRVNIGNAKLLGLEEDLGLHGNQYQIAVAVLFATYVICDFPSNMLIKKLKPNRVIPTLAIAFGIIASCTAAVQSFGGLIIVRLLLGIAESGLAPGIILYFTQFYTSEQLTLRVSYMLCGSSISGACGGLIAYGVSYMDGVGGLRAWRWLMLVEGIIPIIFGCFLYFILPEHPSNARFLDASERALFLQIRQADVNHSFSTESFNLPDAIHALGDPEVWFLASAHFLIGLSLYSLGTFLPTIIQQTGHWNKATSNALTVPVYALGFITFLTIAALVSTHRFKGLAMAGCAAFAAAGVGMLLANHSAALSYAGTFVAISGLYAPPAIGIAWQASNKPRWAQRAISIAINVSLFNCAGIAVPFLFPNDDAPGYRTGFATTLGAALLAMCMYAALSIYYWRVNRRRSEGKQDWRVEGKTEKEMMDMGDRSPKFVYVT